MMQQFFKSIPPITISQPQQTVAFEEEDEDSGAESPEVAELEPEPEVHQHPNQRQQAETKFFPQTIQQPLPPLPQQKLEAPELGQAPAQAQAQIQKQTQIQGQSWKNFKVNLKLNGSHRAAITEWYRKACTSVSSIVTDILLGLFSFIEGFLPFFGYLNAVSDKIGASAENVKLLVLLLTSVCVSIGYALTVAKYALLGAAIHGTMQPPQGKTAAAGFNEFCKLAWALFFLQWFLFQKFLLVCCAGDANHSAFAYYETFSLLCLFLLLYKQRIVQLPQLPVPPTGQVE